MDREEMAFDPFYSRCCIAPFDVAKIAIANRMDTCEGRVNWHHALTYAGKRIPDKWAILPVCEFHHKVESRFRQVQKRIILSRVNIQTIKNKYPKIIL